MRERGFLFTRISERWSSGISASFGPWNLGMTSCIDKLLDSASPYPARRRKFTNRMTLAEGVDVKEGQGLIALEELQRRDLP